MEVSSARPHDSQHFDDVLIGNETEVWADSAYRSEEREKQLEEADIKSQVNVKAQRNKPLSETQKAANREKSKVRARVEHCYAQIKVHHGFNRTRYYGMKANRCDAFCHAIAYNFRRGVFLLKQQVQNTLQEMKKTLILSETRETCA